MCYTQLHILHPSDSGEVQKENIAGESKSMTTKKIKRNDPCPCGSGKKYKQCCMRKDEAPRRTRAILAHRLADQEMSEDVAEEWAAYEATFDEIEAATESMDAYRSQFEQILNDPQAIAEHAQNLFAGARFAPYHYPAADVRRACEVSAYPEPPPRDASGYVQFLNIATAYLADKKSRLRISRELLQMIPDYVAEERYMDAWLIQFCAYHMAETPNQANPFMVQMFEHGLNEWRAEVVRS